MYLVSTNRLHPSHVKCKKRRRRQMPRPRQILIQSNQPPPPTDRAADRANQTLTGTPGAQTPKNTSPIAPLRVQVFWGLMMSGRFASDHLYPAVFVAWFASFLPSFLETKPCTGTVTWVRGGVGVGVGVGRGKGGVGDCTTPSASAGYLYPIRHTQCREYIVHTI